jgi:hypothetical protein
MGRFFVYLPPVLYMVALAQLVRALDCGSRGRGFEPHRPPTLKRGCLIETASFFMLEH